MDKARLIETWVSLTCQLERSPKAYAYERAAGILNLWGESRLIDDVKDMQHAIEREQL